VKFVASEVSPAAKWVGANCVRPNPIPQPHPHKPGRGEHRSSETPDTVPGTSGRPMAAPTTRPPVGAIGVVGAVGVVGASLQDGPSGCPRNPSLAKPGKNPKINRRERPVCRSLRTVGEAFARTPFPHRTSEAQNYARSTTLFFVNPFPDFVRKFCDFLQKST